MSYTTVASVKTELPRTYQNLATVKLTEDGWINAAGTFDEDGFVTQFIDRTASFIESYLSAQYTAPLSQCGLLETINRCLTTYEIEMYLQAAQVNRGVNITIYTQRKEAIQWLDKILDGTLELPLEDEAPYQGTVRLIDGGGEPIRLEELEDDVLYGTTDPMVED